jgi:RNA polymerase-binding protein DksA
MAFESKLGFRRQVIIQAGNGSRKSGLVNILGREMDSGKTGPQHSELGTTDLEKISQALQSEKVELERRINAIHSHARDPLEADSAEQAAQLGNVAVKVALENEGLQEVAEINAALQRLEAGSFGICVGCGEDIDKERLHARPWSSECLDCAELD